MGMVGVLTNFKEWYFTKFNFLSEAHNKVSMQDRPQHAEQHPRLFDHRNAFEVSQKFEILNDDNRLMESELQKVVKILEWLALCVDS